MREGGKKVVLVGPTGVGKTSLAISLAERFHAEIVSTDSMQIYRFLDIATAKPTLTQRTRVPHHLIDCISPFERYHAARYREDAERVMGDIERRGKKIILTGGTGLYLRALLQGILPEYPRDLEIRKELELRVEREGIEVLREELRSADPKKYLELKPQDHRRIIRALSFFLASGGIPISSLQKEWAQELPEGYLIIGVTRERASLYERINRRVESMVEEGLVEETRQLAAMGIPEDATCWQAIGYRQMMAFLRQECTLEEAIERIKLDSRHYAKRQLTWFRGVDSIRWFDLDEDEIERKIADYINIQTGWDF